MSNSEEFPDVIRQGFIYVLSGVKYGLEKIEQKIYTAERQLLNIFVVRAVLMVLAIHMVFILSVMKKGIATYYGAMFLAMHFGIFMCIILIVIYMPTGPYRVQLYNYTNDEDKSIWTVLGNRLVSDNRKAILPCLGAFIAASGIFISLFVGGCESQLPDVYSFSDLGNKYMDFASFSYKGNFLKWSWRKHGLEIKIAEEELPSDIYEMHVNVSATVHRNFELPENSKTASTFFYIQSDYKLKTKVWIKLGHYASDISNLSFGISYDKHPPYTFQVLQGGQFFDDYGVVETSSFSMIGIIGDQTMDPYYYASMYWSIENYNTWRVFLFIVKRNPTELLYLKEYAESKNEGLKLNCETELTIEEGINELTMEISLTDEELENGWYLPNQASREVTIKKEMISNGDFPLPAEAVFYISRKETSTKTLSHSFILEGAEQLNDLLLFLPVIDDATDEQKKTNQDWLFRSECPK